MEGIMARQPDNDVLSQLREIRATLDEHSKQLQALPRIEKQLADLASMLRYSMGVNTEMQIRQFLREGGIDQLFRHSEKVPRDRRLAELDRLIEQFEKMSPEERKRAIEHANEVLRAESNNALDPKTD